METSNKRIEYLDGHRGLAILLVILFHAYARWPELVPYGERYRDFPIFEHGWVGVELFFLVSGFVILMTLEKCSTAKQFIYRRWLRLFPAMLTCTAIIFLTSGYFFERPDGAPNWLSLLPGLTFVEPQWWAKITGHQISGIEGAFWSLYVEFKFYVFAAIIYYWKGRDVLIRALILAFFSAAFLKVMEKFFGINNLGLINKIFSASSFIYFGWFASGASFYVFSQNRSYRWFAIAVSVALSSAIALDAFNWHTILAGSIISIFLLRQFHVKVLKYFWKVALFNFLELLVIRFT